MLLYYGFHCVSIKNKHHMHGPTYPPTPGRMVSLQMVEPLRWSARSASKDFPMASFHVAMGRIQQLALSKANCKVPCHEDQLARLRSKQGKAERLKLGFALTVHYHMGPLLGYLHYHFFIQRK